MHRSIEKSLKCMALNQEFKCGIKGGQTNWNTENIDRDCTLIMVWLLAQETRVILHWGGGGLKS